MIEYRNISKYKYELVSNYLIRLPFSPPHDITTEYISFTTAGYLVIRDRYGWDGPSGPTIDTEDFMRGSLVHDALYQLMREGHLSTKFRKHADKALKRICIEDGMSRVRAEYVYWAVRLGAKSCATPKY